MKCRHHLRVIDCVVLVAAVVVIVIAAAVPF